MFIPYTIDPTDQYTIATGPLDQTLTVPIEPPVSSMQANLASIGSEWFLVVDGAAVAMNVGGAAVYGANAVVQQGSYLTNPLRMTPGQVLHFITNGGTGTVSIIRARRAS
jgi:hypothetical protein